MILIKLCLTINDNIIINNELLSFKDFYNVDWDEPILIDEKNNYSCLNDIVINIIDDPYFIYLYYELYDNYNDETIIKNHLDFKRNQSDGFLSEELSEDLDLSDD